MIEREIEVKYMLSQDAFKVLRHSLFSTITPIKQANHYFDTTSMEIANQHHAMLRIREKGDHCILTLKKAASTGEGLMEYHQEHFQWNHEAGTLHLFPGAVSTELMMMGVDTNSLHHLTSLITYRHELAMDGGLLCLDENHYNGIIDYELECEHQSFAQAEELLTKVLAPIHPTPRKSVLNKVQRAFSSLSK